MLRTEASGFTVVWEAAPRPTLECPTRGMVTPDDCQSCYVWRADREPGWCRIGAQRRAQAARAFGPIEEEETTREASRQATDAKAWDWTPTEELIIQRCIDVVETLHRPTAATTVMARAMRLMGRKHSSNQDCTLAMVAARRCGRDGMVTMAPGTRDFGGTFLAVQRVVQAVMAMDRDVTNRELVVLVERRTGIYREQARAHVARARTRIIHADSV